MWERRTFHDCARELSAISEDFRSAHTNRWGWAADRCQRVLHDSSTRGVEVLRVLALAIRSDADYGLTQIGGDAVGVIRERASAGEVATLLATYRSPFDALAGYSPLRLRQALNKVAHANPARCGFYADTDHHDLILTGDDRGATWIAVFSLILLCDTIRALPDLSLRP